MGDPIEEAIDDLVDRWHVGEGDGLTLAEWLGMSGPDYALWARGAVPDGYQLPDRPAPGPPPEPTEVVS